MSRKRKKGKNNRDPMSHARKVGMKTRRRPTVMGICNKKRERLKKYQAKAKGQLACLSVEQILIMFPPHD